MKIINTALGGIVVGSALTYSLLQYSSQSDEAPSPAANKPLYWVAPMDPTYRRDQPGKSPMGMDLVPVYADNDNETNSAGVVRISPEVINNLGVRTDQVSRSALQIPINTVGYVRYNEDSLVHIHPRVEGWVDTLYVKTSGQQIDQGAPLYALYSPQLVNAQEEFLLAQKRQNSSLMAASLERLKALQMPQQNIDQLSKTGKVLQTVVFTAPQSGIIDNLNIREGFYVKPGTTLMSIGALDEVWVEAEIFERQAPLVKASQQATMTLGFLPGETWQGKLDYIYPTLDPVTRTIRVRLRFANPQRKLKPNMFAQLTIYTELADNTLLVPREAIIRTGSQDRVVLALGEGQFKSVAVRLGVITADKVQILSGVNEGDTLVTSAQFLLDSESSIDSDFKRMDHADTSGMAEQSQQTDDDVPRATVKGQIRQIDRVQRTLTIAREAIDKWQRPAATVTFAVADGVAIDELASGQTVHFTFEIQNDGQQQKVFMIVSLMVLSHELHVSESDSPGAQP